MLQEYLVAKIGVDTAENEPSDVSPKWGVQSGSFPGHYQEMRLNVTYLDVALGIGKLSGLKDAERAKKPALGGLTAFKPRSQVALL